MSYALGILALPGLPASFTDTVFPVLVKNGLAWIADSERAAVIGLLGTKTDPFVETQWDSARYGNLFLASAPRTGNWVEEQVKQGHAVVIRPTLNAIPAIGFALLKNAFDLSIEVGRSSGAKYAILAAPGGDFVTEAEKFEKQKSATPLEPAFESEEAKKAALPKWLIPTMIGIGVVSLLALMK